MTADALSKSAVIDKSALTLNAARAVLERAERVALERGYRMCFAVVDDGGHLLCFARMDGVHLATIEVALAKARCALGFRRPTSRFQEGLAQGALGLLSLPGLVPFAGGEPLIWRGQTVGAIGVSGAAPEQDGTVAQSAAALLSARSQESEERP